MMEAAGPDLARRFRDEFGRPHELRVRAPGRVNLIGEHTDYNDGFVLPSAIDRAITILASMRSDGRIAAVSVDFSQRTEFETVDQSKDDAAPWSNYLRGVVAQFRKRGLDVPGMNLLVAGDVPIGAGLSSSAALEVATAETIRRLGGHPIGKTDMALLCQAAEREFVGVQCGIMDQFVSTLAEEGSALFLDCRDLTYSHVPLRFDARIVVCDSRVRRTLAGSAYNRRRAECEEAVRLLRAAGGGIAALRDVDPARLEEQRAHLPGPIDRRARHVVTENARVLRAVEFLKRNESGSFGDLLYRSHESLRDDYEVSCPELDLLVDLARRQPGTLGARMTGAGFGGCTVNLVRSGEIDRFRREVARAYMDGTGREPLIYVCVPSAGVSSEPVPP